MALSNRGRLRGFISPRSKRLTDIVAQFQSFFTIIVMWMLLYLPESPRWLAMRNRMDEAREVTSRLLDRPHDHAEVNEEIDNIKEALEVQSRGGGFKYRELFTNGPSQNFRRTSLGMAAQFFQQVSHRDGLHRPLSHRLTSGKDLWNQPHYLLRHISLREFSRLQPCPFATARCSQWL